MSLPLLWPRKRHCFCFDGSFLYLYTILTGMQKLFRNYSQSVPNRRHHTFRYSSTNRKQKFMDYCVTTYNTGRGVGEKSLPQETDFNYCASPSNKLPNIYYKLLLLLLLLLLCIELNDYELSAIDADRRPMLKKLGSNPAQSMPGSQHSSM